jgi:hypothetical protein
MRLRYLQELLMTFFGSKHSLAFHFANQIPTKLYLPAISVFVLQGFVHVDHKDRL